MTCRSRRGGAASCLHGAPAGVPHTSASLACEMQNPSGPRQPEPPLQPQPLHWQASAATTVEGAGNIRNPNEISTNPLAITFRMGLLPLAERDQCTRFVLMKKEGFPLPLGRGLPARRAWRDERREG